MKQKPRLGLAARHVLRFLMCGMRITGQKTRESPPKKKQMKSAFFLDCVRKGLKSGAALFAVRAAGRGGGGVRGSGPVSLFSIRTDIYINARLIPPTVVMSVC